MKKRNKWVWSMVLVLGMSMTVAGCGDTEADTVTEEKSVVVDVKIDQVAGSLDLVLNDVKFAANMPLTLDITLKEIPYLVNDGALNFSATNVAPCINAENEPVAAYTFASVNGVIEGDRLLLDAKMAEDLAAYVAGMEFTFEGTEIDK